MRLLTHNYLKSNVRGTENGYPLTIEAKRILYEESPMDPEFILEILKKVNYSTLQIAVQQITPLCVENSISIQELPQKLNVSEFMGDKGLLSDEVKNVIQNLHKVLFDIHVTAGVLICPDTGRKFPIVQGIPNMVLHEDEI